MKNHFLKRGESFVSLRPTLRYLMLVLFLCSITNVNAQLRIPKKHGAIPVVCPKKDKDMHTKHGIPDTNTPLFALKRANKPATATFEITFGPGAEANPEAKAAFQFALDIWATEIVSAVPIRVFADFATLREGVLASAGPRYQVSNFPGAPEPDVVYPAALANSLAGEIIFPDEPFDLAVSLGNGIPYYFGLDGNTPAGQFDFVTIALHEIGHGLGFTTRRGYDEDTGNGTLRNGAEPSVFGLFLVDGDGNRLLDFEDPSITLGDAIVGGDVFADGPFATAALGGTFPEIYAPATFAGGSSLAHWDEATFPAGDPNSLMTPQAGRAESNFDIGAITRGHFKDMGWVLNDTDTPLLVVNPKVFSTELNVGESALQSFTISNIANETLEVTVTSTSDLIGLSSDPDFTLDSAAFTTLDVFINTEGSPKGFYEEAVLLTVPGNPTPVRIPIDIRVLDGTELPIVEVNPTSFEETLDQFQVARKDLEIINSGDGDFSYFITPSDQIIVDTSTTPLYTTDFEDFEFGDVVDQSGWAARFDNNWIISDTNPASGTKHIRGISDGLGSTRDRSVRLGSPVIVPDDSKPFTVFKGSINIQGSGVTWNLLTQAVSQSSSGTWLRFNPDGSMEVRDGGNFVPLSMTTPEGYFDIKISVDRDTSEFRMYFDDEFVYSGVGNTNLIDQVVILSDMEQEGSTFDLDNFEIINGDSFAPLVSVVPAIGTVAFSSTKVVDLKIDTRSLDPGMYETSVTLVNTENTTEPITIPVRLNVTVPPTIVATPGSLEAFVDASIDSPAMQTKTLTIRNTGASALTYDIQGGSVSFATPETIKESSTILASLDMHQYGVGSSNTNSSAIKADPTVDKKERFALTAAENQRALEFNTKFTDSIFYDSGRDAPGSFVGLGDGRPIVSAVRFEPTKDFTLSAVRNGYRTEQLESAVVILEIYKGGTTPTDGKLLLAQTIDQVLPSGGVVVEQLNTSLFFESGEDFWIVHKYPAGINFPQGFDTELENPRPSTFFLSIDGGASYLELPNFPSYVRALGGEIQPYLDVTPQSGSIAPGTSVDVAVTFDATQLPNGVYEAPILINNNDPINNPLEIPTTFTVTGQVPEVSVTDELVLFENVFIGNQKEIAIPITNTGLATLELSNMLSNTEEFQISKDEVNIPAGATYQLFVNFIPNKVGSSNGIIALKSNDPNRATVEIVVNGNGVAPPVAVLPEVVTATVNRNDSATITVSLENAGVSPLTFSTDTPILTAPDNPIFITNITPISGVVAANSSRDLELTVDATGLTAGTYINAFDLESNAPDKSTSRLIIALEVLPIVEITRFDLINADTDTVIGTLEEGSVIDLADFDNNSFNIVAVPGGLNLGSVLFDFNGIPNFSTENVAPFALAGDIAGNFDSLALPFGINTITAKVFTGDNGTGTEGTGLTVNFEVIDSVTPYVTDFILINADTDTVIGPLTEGMVVNTTAIGTANLNVAAITGVAPVGIVAFDLNGVENFRTERAAPFTLAGDVGEDFRAIQFPEGVNTLTARPGSPDSPRLFGAPFTVNFEVISTPPVMTIESVSPNPTEGMTDFVVKNHNGESLEAYMINLLGTKVLQPSDFTMDANGHGSMNMSSLPDGTYILTINSPSGSDQKIVVKE